MTSSLLAARLGSQTPRVSTYPPSVVSGAGRDVVDLAEVAGLVLDPWQRYVLEHGLGEQLDGKWAAREVACWVPRQNGKGVVIEARVLAGLFLFGEKRILWSAHEYKTAQEGFLRIRELIQNAPEFDTLVKRYWEGSGEQGIELTTGQRLKFIARSRGSGRGFSGDLIVLDEAQELTLLQMKALFSTMSAKSVDGNPQIWYFGTPPEDPAAWVYGIRDDGQTGKDRLAYFDWGLGEIDLSAPIEDQLAQYADRDLWYQANPGLGIRISEEFCEDELSRLREGFASERLGLWLPRATIGSGVIPADLWRDLAVSAERPADVAFAIHVNLTRTYAAISYSGRREDGSMLVGLADWRPGTSWVVERAVDLKAKWNPVAIGVDTRSESLLLDLEKAGITPPEDPEQPKRGDLAVPTATEAAAAFGMFVDAARARGLHHLDEGPLNVALAGAKTRMLAGGSTWDHKSPVEIGPLSAATLAHWAYLTRIESVSEMYDPLANIW